MQVVPKGNQVRVYFATDTVEDAGKYGKPADYWLAAPKTKTIGLPFTTSQPSALDPKEVVLESRVGSPHPPLLVEWSALPEQSFARGTARTGGIGLSSESRS